MTNKIVTGPPPVPDEVDQTSIARFYAGAVETFCREATPEDFRNLQHRFESALRAYADHARQGNERSASPLRDEAISILSEVVRRRRVAHLEAIGKGDPNAR